MLRVGVLAVFMVALLAAQCGAAPLDELRARFAARALEFGAYSAGAPTLLPHTCIHDALLRSERAARVARGLAPEASTFSPQSYDHVPLAAAATDAAESAHACSSAHTHVHEHEHEHAPSRDVAARTTAASSVASIRIVVDWRYWGAADVGRTCMSATGSVQVGTQSNAAVVCTDSVTENCWLECTEERVLTTVKSDYLRNVVVAEAVEWLQSALRVIRVSGNLTVASPSTCGFQGGVTIPSAFLTGGTGSPSSDIVLFATGRPTTSSVIAFAGACKQDQFGRPVMGQMNFGPNRISLALEDHRMQVGVAAHEIAHALGFQGGMFPSFKAALNTSTPHATTTASSTLVAGDARTFVVTPKVRETVRAHFACATLAGGEIEDSGGSGTAGSHWEKRTYNDEFMTGTSSPKPVLSALSLALFEDSGWYLPDYSVAERLDWGRAKGCAFATGSCGTWSALGFGYECAVASSGAESCTYDRKAKGFCEVVSYAPTSLPAKYQHMGDAFTGGFSDLADYCPLVRPYSNALCAYESSATSNSFFTGENFAAESMCFESSLLAREMPSSSTVRNTCYRSLCMGPAGPLRVRVGLIWLTCETTGQQLSLSTYHGAVTCPDIAFVCAGTGNSSAGIVWPEYDDIVPKSVSGDGGDRVTVTGRSFFAGMAIYVGFHECTDLTVNSSTTAECVVAPQPEVTETSKQSVSTFNADGQGGSGFQVIEIRAASGGFLQTAKNFVRRLSNWLAEHWYWILPVLILLLVLCFLSKVCSSSKKQNKVAPMPPPGGPHQRYGAPTPYGGYPQPARGPPNARFGGR